MDHMVEKLKDAGDVALIDSARAGIETHHFVSEPNERDRGMRKRTIYTEKVSRDLTWVR